MARVRLKGKKYINRVVSHDGKTRAEVYDTAEEIAVKAEALLAPHRNDGSHRIETSHGATDSYVSLTGPAAASVEFGHWLVYYGEPTEKFIQGLYILHRAAGLQAKANSARMRR